MTKASSSDIYSALRQIRPAMKHISEAVEIKSKEFGLSVGTRAVLEQVSEHGPLPVPAIAKNLLVERQYVQRNVDELLKIGLVQRQKNPDHKRSWLITPTTNGKNLFAELKKRESAVLTPLTQELSLSEIQNTEKVLRRLSNYFSNISVDGGTNENA